MVVGFRHKINYSEKKKQSFPDQGVLHKNSGASSAAKKMQVRQQEKNISNDKADADCGEPAEFPPLETFKNWSDEYIRVRQEPSAFDPVCRCDLFRPLPLL